MEKRRSKIRAILFDFIGVLLIQRSDYQSDIFIDAIDMMIGKAVDDKLFKETVKEKYQINDNKLGNILRIITEKYVPFTPMWDLLPNLRKNYKLGIINNGIYLTYKEFDVKLDLTNKFDIFISSGKEGICKPDPKIYLLACKGLEVDPTDCLFIDDSKENVIGAQKLGMSTIYWQNSEESYKSFLKLVKT
jgi:epoxide hydrolase-like predicted phosphatase